MARIGLQLYTVKDETRADILGVLRQVGAMGYDGVELPWVPDEPAAVIRDVLVEAKLAVAGVVVTRQEMEARHQFDAAIGYSLAIGSPTIVFPWLDEPWRNSAAAYRRTAAILTQRAAKCRDAGLAFLYHIHGYEFAEFDGKRGLELLMENADPDLVKLELDTYWVEHGGADALATFLQYRDRCRSIHFKDTVDRVAWHDVEVGDGVIDTRGIVAAAKDSPVDWFIVEQERFTMPSLESAAVSARNLRRVVEEIG